MPLIGRKAEWAALADRNGRPQAQMIAVYGRRRVGKTYLVETFFTEHADRMMTVIGRRAASRAEQLQEFRFQLEHTFGRRVPTLTTWNNAFLALSAALATLAQSSAPPSSVCIFLDELPWMDTHRSGLVDALGHVWEAELKKFPFVRLVLCGSAASWMIRKIINDKGSLHNRVSERIKVQPFHLAEVEEYFQSRAINFGRSEILELYLALGGLPYYLDLVRDAESPAQAIARICFGDGPLVDERSILFAALFDHPDNHNRIVDTLAQVRGGMTRRDLVASGVVTTGGSLDKYLAELEASGFIAKLEHWTGKTKDVRYLLFDPFLLFNAHAMQGGRGLLADAQSSSRWFNHRASQTHAVAQGYAFENCCLQHVDKIRGALGLTEIPLRITTWKQQGNAAKNIQGGQVDLVFDRSDGRISLCEMKYYPNGVTIDGKYAKWVNERGEIFKADTKTNKSIENVLVASHGAAKGKALIRCFPRVVTMEDLFSPHTS